jgi:predicted nucleic-acid-binding Zn-ribbon protein
MSDIAPEDWQREMERARAALGKRFPNMRCLRCGQDNFLLRMWPDPSLVPGLASSADNRVIELICENCGFQEKHVVKMLAAEATN